jgi:anti-anti-sigma regulatory factor
LPSCVVVYCDVSRALADAQTVDGLARLRLAIRRCGYEMKLCGPSEELRGLIELMGLDDVLSE